MPFPALFSRFTHALRAIARLRNALLRALRSPIFPIARRRAARFFLSGGLTRTSSSARISAHLNRTVRSCSELRRTPAQQGFAPFVTGSATRGGTR
ncbi:hypothetical protein K6W17_26005 [Burkholderia dolosa]|nr:hypothetical protein [Burkholderia dolosa]